MELNELTDTIYAEAGKLYQIGRSDAFKIAKYVVLLLKWNKVYNLTAITNIDDVVRLHILDGLSIMPHLKSIDSIIDVGSGMGVPGILIAIIYPQMKVSLIDMSSKKTTFLKQVVIELGLTNVDVITGRVENYFCQNGVAAVISRAFTSSNLFIHLTKHLLNDNASWLLMKSKQIDSELAQITDYKYNIIDLGVDEIVGERYLLKIYNKVI